MTTNSANHILIRLSTYPLNKAALTDTSHSTVSPSCVKTCLRTIRTIITTTNIVESLHHLLTDHRCEYTLYFHRCAKENAANLAGTALVTQVMMVMPLSVKLVSDRTTAATVAAFHRLLLRLLRLLHLHLLIRLLLRLHLLPLLILGLLQLLLRLLLFLLYLRCVHLRQ